MSGASDGPSRARTCRVSLSMPESRQTSRGCTYLMRIISQSRFVTPFRHSEGPELHQSQDLPGPLLQVVSLGTTRLDVKGAQAESSVFSRKAMHGLACFRMD